MLRSTGKGRGAFRWKYVRNRRLPKRGPKRKEPIERFNAMVEEGEIKIGQTTPCRIWCGAIDAKGHPIFGLYCGMAVKAHRFIYEFTNGTKLDKGRWLDHTCGDKLCVEPDHLKIHRRKYPKHK